MTLKTELGKHTCFLGGSASSIRLESLEGKDSVVPVTTWGLAQRVHLVKICGISLLGKLPFDVFLRYEVPSHSDPETSSILQFGNSDQKK